MLKKDAVYYNNPLIYIFLVFLLASFTYEIYFYNKLAAIIIAASLLFLLEYNLETYLKIILIIIFIIAIRNNSAYFNFKPSENEEIRILSLKYNYGVGEIKGRKVNLTIDSDEDILGSRIYAKGRYEEEVNISKGIIGNYYITDYKRESDDFKSYLYKVKKNLYNKINDKLGARKAGIISAVAYGDDDNIDEYDREEMKYYGIAHSICVSGLHMTIVYLFITQISSKVIGLVLAFIYMVFSGAREAAIRAYIMIVVTALAKIVKRDYNMLAALALAGIVIIIMKPYSLFNIGFILSFINILGIYLLNVKLNKVLYKIPSKIRTVIAITLSTQIFIIPITMIYFNEFCANSILGNIIIIPIINLIIVLGNLLIIALKMPIIFNYLLFICKYLIIFMDKIMNILGEFTFDIFYFYYGIAYLYISMIITYYFYKKGYKRFIYYPAIVLVYVVINIYSPIVNIKYYNDGGLLVSYRGRRVVVEFNKEADEDKLLGVTLCEKILKSNSFDKLGIKENTYLLPAGENYMLIAGKEKCLLKVNYDKISCDYEIIDFTKGNVKDVWIVNDIIISRK